jgi:hypothetical protein
MSRLSDVMDINTPGPSKKKVPKSRKVQRSSSQSQEDADEDSSQPSPKKVAVS